MSRARPHGEQGWADSLSRLVVLRCQPGGVLGERVGGAEAGFGGADGERGPRRWLLDAWSLASLGARGQGRRPGLAPWPLHTRKHKSKSP